MVALYLLIILLVFGQTSNTTLNGNGLRTDPVCTSTVIRKGRVSFADSVPNYGIVVHVPEPTVIEGRPYSCYASIPCALTRPCSPPNWDSDVPGKSPPNPCGNTLELPNPVSSLPLPIPPPIPPPLPPPVPSCGPCCCCSPYCPTCSQNFSLRTKKKKSEGCDINKIMNSILQLPGLIADMLVNDQVTVQG